VTAAIVTLLLLNYLRFGNALECRASYVRREQLPDPYHCVWRLPGEQIGDLLRRQGLELPRCLVRVIEKVALAPDNGLRYTQDGGEALLDVAHRPPRFL